MIHHMKISYLDFLIPCIILLETLLAIYHISSVWPFVACSVEVTSLPENLKHCAEDRQQSNEKVKSVIVKP